MRSKLKQLLNILDIKRIPFREDINGLRAIAVMSVVFYHADFEIFQGGWLGVDIFFVISGYLISNIIISELNQETFSFKKFYLRRINRILPALLSVLVLTIPFAYWLLLPGQMLEYSNSLLSSVFFYSNYYFQNLDFYNSAPAKYMPLLHTWSLSIEEQYYLLFPILAFTFHKYFRKYFAHFIALLLLISILLNGLSSDNNKFYGIQFRLWELLLGVLIMVVASNLQTKHLENIGIVMMLFPIFYFDSSDINQIEPKLISLVGISLILLSNNERTTLSKILRLNIFQIIGLSSYSIYLLHQPIFSFMENYLKGRLIQNNVLIKNFLVIVVIFLGYLFFQLFEKRLTKSRFVYHYLVLVVIIITIFSFRSLQTEGYDERYSETSIYLKKYFDKSQRGGVDENLCLEDPFSNLEVFCNTSFNPDNKNLVILGDSHLKTLSKAIYDNYNSSYNLFISTRDGCPFIAPIESETQARCAGSTLLEEYLLITNTAETITIFGGRFPWYFNGLAFESDLGSTRDNMTPGGQAFLNDLRDNIAFLKKNSDSLIIIEPIPELGFFPLEPYLWKNFSLDEAIQYEYSYWEAYSKEINSLLRMMNKDNISTDKIFCDSFIKNKCVVSDSGIMFYYDDDHLTYDGSLLILDILKKRFLTIYD